MARIARVFVPEYPHHISQRLNHRHKAFFFAKDYDFYIEINKTFTSVKVAEDQGKFK